MQTNANPDKDNEMQPQLITVTRGDTTLSTSDSGLALQVLNEMIGAAMAIPFTPAGVPEKGHYWPGQGGIYAGIRQYPDGLFHVVFAKEDMGSHAWGEYGTETVATSKVDGALNRAALLAESGHFPAAETAANYMADGHTDFYLPGIGELNHAWQFIPESFEKAAYWSSTQRSANLAFSQYFVVGIQHYDGKHNELRVRPVRRLPI